MMDAPGQVAIGDRGMVVTPHYLASAAALRVLQEGGNAMDAAITANAVLTVVEPDMCALGGDLFLLLWSQSEGTVVGLNASGAAPQAATRDAFRQRGLAEIPRRGPLSISVPGTVDGWAVALERYGTRSLAEVLRPARFYAQEGFRVGRVLARAIARQREVLAQDPYAARLFLPQGRPRAVGDLVRQPQLAATLQTIMREGRDGFYRGTVGHAIGTTVQNRGGLLTAADVAGHPGAEWVTPLATTYRDHDIYAMPPNSQGLTTLQMLNVLSGFNLGNLEPGGADLIHLMVEAKRVAFTVRDRLIADPRWAEVPVAHLLSPAWADEQRRAIDPQRAGSRAAAPESEGDTVYLAVVDRDGNGVSLIQSVYLPFGSGVFAEETGVLLHNRGTDFWLDDEHPNRLEPGKRPFHTLSPGLALRHGRLSLLFGTRGAGGQPQTHSQVLVNLLDFGMALDQAITAPRWLSGARGYKDPHVATLLLESRFAPAVLEELARRGHAVQAGAPWDDEMGHAHLIRVDQERGGFWGATDPRCDGAALAW